MIRITLLILSIVAMGPISATADDAIHRSSLARWAPPDTGFFVELNRLGAPDGDELSSRAKTADRLYSLVFGSTETDGGRADWQRILRSLGLKPGDTARELLSRRFAVAAPSLRRLAEGMIIVQLEPDDVSLERDFFPPDNIDTIDGRGDVTIYRTRNVLSAAMNSRVLVLSQRHNQGSMYRRCVRLMMTHNVRTLAATEDFKRSLASLADGLDVLVYMNGGGGAVESTDIKELLGLHLARGTMGLYLHDDGVRVSVHGVEVGSRSKTSVPEVPVAQILSLPQSTLGLWCTKLDVGGAIRRLVAESLTGKDAPKFFKLLAGAIDIESINQAVLEKLGTGAVVVWDQYLGSGPDVPQLAIMIRADDAADVRDGLADTVQIVVDWLDLQDRGASGRPIRFSQSEYLGQTVYELELPATVWGAFSDKNGGLLFRPAFTSMDDWLIVATGADQIRNMIDAHWGLTPTLGVLPDVRDATRSDVMAAFALAQPALAAEVVDSWIKEPDAPVRRWFERLLVDSHTNATMSRAPRLGIGVRAGSQPGTVEVVRVYANGRAHGVLLPGDTVVGVNGRLLNLESPADHIRRDLAKPGEDGSWAFRVRRGGEILNLSVDAQPKSRGADGRVDPIGAMRQLQSVAEIVDFASIRVAKSDVAGFSADLNLRFADAQPSSAGPRD